MIDIADDIWEARAALPLPSEVKAGKACVIGWLTVDSQSRELHQFIFEKEFIYKRGKHPLCIGWKLKDIKKK